MISHLRKGKKKMKELAFEEYVELFLTIVPKAEKVDRITYRGRCPICGDSKKIKNKKRMYLMRETRRKPTMIYCHNCGINQTAFYFFTSHYPEQTSKYRKTLSEKDLSNIKEFISSEKSSNDFFINTLNIQEINPEEYFNLFNEEVERAKTFVGKFFDECTYSVLDNPEAYGYLTNRMIPDKYIREMLLLKPEYHDYKTFRFAYFKDYVIVPFIDQRDNKPYYFHSRRYKNLNDQFARYLSCPYKPQEAEVDFFLNEMRIDPNKIVVVGEGTFDSLNLENNISVNGVKKITKDFIQRLEYRFGGEENIIYALDNETQDVDARNKTKELLRQGKRVFLWSLFIKDHPSLSNIHDFNDLCQLSKRKRIPTHVIEKYSTNNVSALLKD